ncbi:cell division protein SepF [archaeon]|nr:cell division protein SepF [archaeon]MBT6698763.1 cell division protein SepF [archaeon]
MRDFFLQLKEKFVGSAEMEMDEMEETNSEYVELGAPKGRTPDKDSKVVVRPFVMEDFEDIKPVLDSLRQGKTIALINIKPLKEKDIVELKRAINKLRKTCDAIDGDIAGLGEDYVVAAPYFARIYRGAKPKSAVPAQDPSMG